MKWIARQLRRAHNDDRGNLGILLLLVIMALMTLIGLVWNTGEYAVRRKHVQNAADTAAHAVEMWRARAMNMVTAANMMMCENGSAQVIWQSITPTATSIDSHLRNNENAARRILIGNQPGVGEANVLDIEWLESVLETGNFANNGQGTKLLNDLAQIDQDGQRALTALQPLLGAQQWTDLRDRFGRAVRRDGIAVTWIRNTWIGGAQPPDNNFPPPPVAGGLRGLCSAWIEQQAAPRMGLILSSIAPQRSFLDLFIAQTDPALQMVTAEQLAVRREPMFDYQKTVMAQAPAAAEEQRSQLQGFYKCDVTVATPAGTGGASGPAVVVPPLETADVPENLTHVDSVRIAHPVEAEAAFGTSDPTISIDPINVHVDQSAIWHPGADVSAPPLVSLNGQVFSGVFRVHGGRWGALYCAPLARNFNRRVWRDAEGLRPYMTSIDDIRAQLRAMIWPVPTRPMLDWDTYFPPFLPDVPPEPPINLPPDQLPRMTTHRDLTPQDRAMIDDLNQRIDQFNRDVRTYVSHVQDFADPDRVGTMYRFEERLVNVCDGCSTGFANWTWSNHVDSQRHMVLEAMGRDKRFMIINSYNLRYIPDWAQPGMWQSSRDYLYNWVYGHNIDGVTRQAEHRIERWAYPIIYQDYLTRFQRQNPTMAAAMAARMARRDARQFGLANGRRIADPMVQQAGDWIASETASEWIRRPWPYEITPPPDPVPPTAGLQPEERLGMYTLLSAARTSDEVEARMFLPKFFGVGGGTMSAYAQAETFNWMEFDGAYGAGDPYDRVDSGYGGHMVGGSPAPWRLATIGGWSWQPRLAMADALPAAMENNPEFGAYLGDGGVTTYDDAALEFLTMH